MLSLTSKILLGSTGILSVLTAISIIDDRNELLKYKEENENV